MSVMHQLDLWLWQFGRADFYQSMGDAFANKVSLREFLTGAVHNAQILGQARTKRVLRRILLRLSEGHGQTLTELLGTTVPRSDLMLLASVDEARIEQQAQALHAVARSVEFKLDAAWLAVKASGTPLLIVPFVGFLSYITAQSIQGLAQSNANPAIWSGFNGFVKTLSVFVLNQWLMLTLALVALVVLALWYFPRATGPLRLKIDKLPVLGIYRDFQGAMVINALGLLLSNGKSFVEALGKSGNAAVPGCAGRSPASPPR